MNHAALLVIDLQNEYRPGAAWPVVRVIDTPPTDNVVEADIVS